MERRLTSEQIDKLLDEIVTEDFIINALKEFNLYPEFQQTYEVVISQIVYMIIVILSMIYEKSKHK